MKMDINTAKKILADNHIEIARVDESKADSRNLDSAYDIRPIVKGSEEAPEGYDTLDRIYWDEWGKLHNDGLIDYGGTPKELRDLEPESDTRGLSGDEPRWVVKKLWYRVAEYMIDHDNEPCSAAEIKRGIGIEGYAQSFQKMRRDGFLQEVSKTKVILSDWAAEKYYAAKEHAEEDRIAKERECIRKYGTLEDQLKAHDADLARIKKGFADYRANHDQRLRDQRRDDIKDYFDKRRTTTESINESFAKDPSSYLRRFAKIRERVVKKATAIDPELMAHYKVTPLARQLNPHYEGDYLDRLVYGYMDGRPGDTDGMAKDLLAWLSENA